MKSQLLKYFFGAVLLFLGNGTWKLEASSRFTGSIPVSKKVKSEYSDLAKISFHQVLEIISKNHSGKIIEIALEEEDGYLVYEIELITSNKVKKEIILDAGDGSVLKVKEKNIHK